MDKRISANGANFIEASCVGEPAVGKLFHTYKVRASESGAIFATVSFGEDNDPYKSLCTNEDLLAIVLDRLYGVQSGEFKHPENDAVIVKIEECLMLIGNRTLQEIQKRQREAFTNLK